MTNNPNTITKAAVGAGVGAVWTGFTASIYMGAAIIFAPALLPVVLPCLGVKAVSDIAYCAFLGANIPTE